MTLELVLLTPALIAFIMVLAGLGRVVEGQSQVDGAADDSARAASVGRTKPEAQTLAQEAAQQDLTSCTRTPKAVATSPDWGPGGQVSVTVRCAIRLPGLSLIGISVSRTLTGTATAPLDTFRRYGP
jgi:Flp pilus assembly protein TadG